MIRSTASSTRGASDRIKCLPRRQCPDDARRAMPPVGGARIHNVRLLWRTAVPDAAVVRPGWSRCLPLPEFRALGRGYAIIGTGPE